MGLSQHLTQAYPLEYNRLKQNRDLRCWENLRLWKHWTDKELETMDAMELAAVKVRVTTMNHHLADLGRFSDSVGKKRRSERYNTIIIHLGHRSSAELCAYAALGTTISTSSRINNSPPSGLSYWYKAWPQRNRNSYDGKEPYIYRQRQTDCLVRCWAVCAFRGETVNQGLEAGQVVAKLYDQGNIGQAREAQIVG